MFHAPAPLDLQYEVRRDHYLSVRAPVRVYELRAAVVSHMERTGRSCGVCWRVCSGAANFACHAIIRFFDFSIFRACVPCCSYCIYGAPSTISRLSCASAFSIFISPAARRARVLVVYSTPLVALCAAAKYDRFGLTRRGSTDLVAARACTSWCAAVCHREAADLHVLALEQQQRQRHQRQ